MPNDSTDIIIKGGSVEITFDEQTFPSKGGKYSNKDKSIASVELRTTTRINHRLSTFSLTEMYDKKWQGR